MTNNAVILLSGGLDSVVSLALAKENYDVTCALTFNYGQKAFENEAFASAKIAKYYKINHEVINLDWLAKISTSALNGNNVIPQISGKELENKELTRKTSNSVWVPNRNALFVNIAACIAESYNLQYVILGANKEEGQTFKDNSEEFVKSINMSLKNSTNNNVQLITPLIKMNKEEIVQTGIAKNIPFEYLYSCYSNNEKHCGLCESCARLKRALKLNKRDDIIETIFGKEK